MPVNIGLQLLFIQKAVRIRVICFDLPCLSLFAPAYPYLPLIASNSISNTSVAFGGITPPAPR